MIFVIYDYFVFITVFWIMSGIFYSLDLKALHNDNIKYYKINKKLLIEKYYEVCLFVIKTQLFVILPYVLIISFFYKIHDEAFNILYELFCLIIFILVQEVCFYFTHRLFHISFLYKKFHYLHHQYNIPIAPAALYAHPIENIFCNLLPVTLGALIISHSYITDLIWFTLVAVNTTIHHSNYDFSNSKFHNDHHLHVNSNYGLFFMDYIFKTVHKDKNISY
jgi:sterol desaturase/sphingolipid hydroxylase (fatty acid hydroxylase superfamily)